MGDRAEATSASGPLERGALLAVLALALVLRARGLGEWWLNPDEGIYYSTVTRLGFGAFWAEVAANAHPPLYYLLLRFLGLFTWDFFWFRVLSLVCGLAAVYGFWLVGRELGGPVAGLVSALALAVAPVAVELSQVMRPYSLQLALLAGATFLLLRQLEAPATRRLAGYLVLVSLAILTHYSSVMALGVLLALVLHDGLTRGFGRGGLRTLAAAHVLPVLLVVGLWLLHLRPFLASRLAGETLDGWLSFYMVASPREAWLAFVGFQSLLAEPLLRGPLALLLLAALAVSAAGKDRRPLVLGGVGLLAALTGAAAGLYPLGSTRHAAWLMTFTVPTLGWLASRVGSLPRARLIPTLGAVALLVLAGDPVGRWLGRDRAPWSPDDRILRWDDVALMTDVIDPQGRPELVLMSAETFYLLVPFYPREREEAEFSPDGTLFRFRYGERTVVATEAWEFTGAAGSGRGSLDEVLEAADDAFAEVDLAKDTLAVLLVGGWSAPLLRELTAMAESHPFLRARKDVPGLTALLLDVNAYRGSPPGPERAADPELPAKEPNPPLP